MIQYIYLYNVKYIALAKLLTYNSRQNVSQRAAGSRQNCWLIWLDIENHNITKNPYFVFEK